MRGVTLVDNPDPFVSCFCRALTLPIASSFSAIT